MTEPISGAVVKASADFIAKASSGETATLIPRLVVYGDGSGTAWCFNLHIQNVGKVAAYGLEVSIPWDVLERNRSRESRMTEWWSKRQSRGMTLLGWAARKLGIAPVADWASARGFALKSKDVGLVLAPGESVEIYFGMAPTKNRTGPVDGIVWKPGDIAALTMHWWNGMPGWRRFCKPSCKLALAIHTSPGRQVCGHTYWGNTQKREEAANGPLQP